ncbi:unnamed protein product [Schistosoma guineensis]|uniref:PRKCA-binding protein n=1 Tax=Schistosoma haematobium TaxID=6185 RepID=A0A922LNY9_SCHHA|nr:PRKCA-binding protein, variant 2 [Schistosoma haematobium]CAH8636887.1 unnamed protein product [Schistosoma guineensis]CAH8645464.1 unnamed protein product [Schistosoma curassoni]CAH8645588.1 unnamed protein product [Schistosoma bovis]KAH9590668.1 PRKCA-binding protein, variant 2 [Schistosoma haematobium]CAH8651566.1 unnamed protein product [Schistosoma bovis]
MDFYDHGYEENKLGMTVTSGCVKLKKDPQNLVGISIGGGAPYCPCLYVVQIFDSTPASEDGSLQAGDEITGVNGISVKGKTKVEAARLIQSFKDEVRINYNKLHADPKQGKTLDLILKKVKHRIVETMESSTADALGLSRAILVNDGMVKKLEELNKTSNVFSGMVNHAKKLLRAIYELSRIYAVLGDTFSEIGVKEPMTCTSEAFTQFGTIHRSMERFSIEMLKKIKPMIMDLNTFLHKAVPDTKLTIKKYLDVKFEYLSYCLKVKEMDDEEYGFAMVQEPLYRVETGNYEYRLVLRCRQDARTRFAKMRNDVLVKLELLDNKHVQDIVFELQRFIDAMATYHDQCYGVMKQIKIFPLEVDLARDAFAYNLGIFNTGEDEGGEDIDEDVINTESVGEKSVSSKYNQLTDDVKLIDLAGINSKSRYSENEGDDEVLDMNNWNSLSTWGPHTGDSKSNKQEAVTDLLCFD